ncbi:MAG TPA: hypothetical protein VM345_01890 [Acidimicrobiales bacterium]|nr:hypothetical protein [Acidimicrobiales bacterium]
MAHPHKGEVPRKIAARLVELQQTLDATREERDNLIVQALNEGGSLTTVAELVGLSPSGVRKIAKQRGWTDAAWKARLEERRDWSFLRPDKD